MASYNARIELQVAVNKALENVQRVQRAVETVARRAVIDIQVRGAERIQQAVDNATEGSRRLARSFQEIENRVLSRLPQSIQTVVAYLKVAASTTQSLALAAAGVGNGIEETLQPTRAYTEEIENAARAMERLATEEARLGRVSALASGRGIGFLQQSLREREAQRSAVAPFDEAGEYERLSRQIVQLRAAINQQLRQQEQIEKNILSYQNDQAEAVRRNLRASKEAREAAGQGFAEFSRNINQAASTAEQLTEKIRKAGGFDTLIQDLRKYMNEYARSIEEVKKLERRQASETSELEFKLSALELENDLKNEAELKKQKEKNLRDLARFDEELAYRVRTKKLKADIAARNQRARAEAVTGAAFPLLFGGGPGAAAGGGIGGFFGGLVGGQFGLALSLLGSQIGTLIDSTVVKAYELGSALSVVTGDVDAVVEALGTAGTSTGELIKTLEDLEGENAALEEATKRLALVVGEDGVVALEDFGDAGNRLANAITQITSQILSDVARLLGGIAALAATSAERKATVSSALKSKDPRLAEAQKQYKTAGLAATRIKAENELIRIQKQITAEQDNQLKNRIYSQRISVDELETLRQKGVILRLNTDLTNVERQNQERTLLSIESERAARALSLKFKKGELDFQEYGRQLQIQEQKYLNNKQDLENRITAAYEKQSKAAAKRNKKQRDDTKAAQKLLIQLLRRRLVLKEVTDLEKELFNITAKQEDVAARITGFKNITDELREQLNIANDQAAAAESLDAVLSETLKKTADAYGALSPIFKEQELLQAKISGTEKELLIQRQIDEILRGRPLLSREAVEQEVRKTEQLKEQNAALEYQKQILNNVVNQVGTQLTGLFENLIFQTEDWTKSLNNALKSLASLLIKAGLSALGGDDGAGVFSILSGNFGKRAMGGPVSSGTPYMVGERGPELFVPRSSGTIVPNNALGGGSSNVVVNVDASGTKVQGDNDQASQLGRVIGSAVQAELIKQKRPGGLLAGT